MKSSKSSAFSSFFVEAVSLVSVVASVAAASTFAVFTGAGLDAVIFAIESPGEVNSSSQNLAI